MPTCRRATSRCAWAGSAGTGTATASRSACRRASSNRWKPPPCCSCSAPPTCWSRRSKKAIWAKPRRRDFNEAVNGQFEGTRDYIVTHYKTNTRTDTDYWRANAANTNLSEPLQAAAGDWLASRPIIGGIKQGVFGRGYPAMSWYSLLAGMGLFPPEDMQPVRGTPAA